jgi:superoxide dismutase, Cu-Zn family
MITTTKILLGAAIWVLAAVSNPALAADAPEKARVLEIGIPPGGDAPAATPEAIIKTAMLKDTKGEAVGEARFTETEGGVLVTLNLYKLPPGEHAFHIHEKGDCSPPGSFTNAGAHLNPGSHPHGFMSDHGPHDGDMPNIFVDANGSVMAHVINTRIKLDEEDASNRALLNDKDGASIVIHAGPDDYATQPAGNAGDRIACGVIK